MLYNANDILELIEEFGSLQCNKCHDVLPMTAEFFYRDSNKKFGFDRRCKACERKRDRKRGLPGTERRDKIRIQMKENYRNNRERYIEQAKIYNDRMKALPKDFSQQDWINLKAHFDNACAYCGSNDVKLEREHVIPVSKQGSYTKDNIMCACVSCNKSKKSRDFLDWYEEQEFFTYERLDKIINRLEGELTNVL